jgi:Mn2+/Fe2+ NRAMP family transporter
VHHVGVDLVQVAALVQAVAAVLLFPFAAAAAGGLRLTPARVIGCLVLGLVCTAAAELVNYHNIRRLGPTTAALAAYIVPIVGIAGGIVFLREAIGVRLAVGTAIVVAAVAFAMPRSAADSRGSRFAWYRLPVLEPCGLDPLWHQKVRYTIIVFVVARNQEGGGVSAAAAMDREDRARSKDRERVSLARSSGSRRRLAWLLVGPGVLAMLGENDGPSMISYTADGATYGIGLFLPFIVVLFAMSYVCQEMCMRVGAVTHRGYGQLVLQRFGPVWGWFGAGDLLVTNLVTLVSEFVAIRVGLAYFHLGAPVAAVLGVVLVAFTAAGSRYWRWERIALGLAIFNGMFLAAAVMVKPAMGPIGRALVTFTPLPQGNLHTVLLLIASTVGATVTPWMIFFQQSGSADKGLTARDLAHGRLDTALGAILAAIFGCGALVVGAVLLTHNGATLQGLAGAGFPAALRSTSGSTVGAVFALGMIEAGAVAILTISASTAYAAGECIGVSHSFNTTPRRARVFHTVNLAGALVAAVVILIPGAPLLQIALNANVLATVLLPVSLLLLLMLATDRGLMGAYANTRTATRLGVAVVASVGLCGLAYGIDSFLQAVHLIPAAS